MEQPDHERKADDPQPHATVVTPSPWPPCSSPARASAPSAAPTQAAGPASRPELGFRIGRTPHADGTWVGRYRVGRQLAYRTQPRKSNAESAYHPAHRVTQAPGAEPGGHGAGRLGPLDVRRHL